MLRLFETHPKEEIPILGSSRASQNFAPSRLSPRAFNYGMDGSGQSETLFLLAALLRQEGAAPILVNLDPLGFVGSPESSLVGDYCLVLGDPDVRARLPPEKRRLKARIPGIRFHGALRAALGGALHRARGVARLPPLACRTAQPTRHRPVRPPLWGRPLHGSHPSQPPRRRTIHHNRTRRAPRTPGPGPVLPVNDAPALGRAEGAGGVSEARWGGGWRGRRRRLWRGRRRPTRGRRRAVRPGWRF